MRRGLRLLAWLCVCGGGCVPNQLRPGVGDIVHALTPPQRLDGVILESVLVERPWGDELLGERLWDLTVPVGLPETRALLAENGLRVGILAGSVPSFFQNLLGSEADTANPQLQTFHQRRDTVLPTSEPADPCRFTVRRDLAAPPEQQEYQRARCGWSVTPQDMGDGRVRLLCEPVLQYGGRCDWYRPNADGTRLTRYEEIPTIRFAPLAFAAVLRPEEYLLVGPDPSMPGTLGQVMFSAEASGRPRQRLLVMRARVVGPPGTTLDLPGIDDPLKRPATATQAATPRSTRPLPPPSLPSTITDGP